MLISIKSKIIMNLSKIKNIFVHKLSQPFSARENNNAKELFLLNNERPIYHVHIRKTAGTTINFAFLHNAGEDVQIFYDSLAKKRNHRQLKNDKVFVGWNISLINEGNYSYAFSHTALHELNLPDNAFVFTCLRDPCKRLISHYNNLRYYQLNNINHPCMRKEGKWLGNSFEDFLNKVPKQHLMNQIFMFSKSFNLNEAHEELEQLDHIVFTEDLNQGLKELESKINWNLPISNQKSFGYKEDISDNLMLRLRESLDLEYELLNKIKKG